jgi:hypothetical protein
MAYIAITSELKRKRWMREGLVQAVSKSFWSPYTGMSEDSVVVQVNNMNASEGHTVVFDYDGNLSGRAVKGKDTAYGKGEKKKKFSNKITVDRYRLVADNGDAFDAVDVGDLSLSQHEDSRSKLADLFVRWKDQMIFDVAQGFVGTTPSHIINFGSTFDYNNLIDLEQYVKSATGFTTGGAIARTPLMPYRLADGRSFYLLILDSFTATKLKKSSGYQTLVYNADVRGEDNRAIKGVIGKLGSLLIVEAEMFFGFTDNLGSTVNFEDTEVEIAGMRRYDSNSAWTGQSDFDTGGTLELTSRNIIVGRNAIQLAFGKMPDYRFQPSQDFGIKSESAVEFWTNAQKTKLVAEMEDYKAAKLAGYDFGIIAVDVITEAAG